MQYFVPEGLVDLVNCQLTRESYCSDTSLRSENKKKINENWKWQSAETKRKAIIRLQPNQITADQKTQLTVQNDRIAVCVLQGLYYCIVYREMAVAKEILTIFVITGILR